MQRIDYARMTKVRRGQKSALTRAINSGDPERVLKVCRDAVQAWESIGFWPDDWARWQRALDDSRHWADPYLSLDDLA